MIRPSLVALALLTTALSMANSSARAEDQLRIEAKPSDLIPGTFDYRLRNVGTEPVTVTGGQYNGRNECGLTPYVEHWGNVVDIKGLRDDVSLREHAKRLEPDEIDIEPVKLEVGDSLNLSMTDSPCGQKGSEVVQIVIRTTSGESSFSR